MQFIEANGIVHHIGVQGPENGPVVVFSNSLGTDFRIWDGVCAALPSGVRILRYDTRGHGLTTAPKGDCTIDVLRDDLLGILDAVGIEKCHLVGLSVGGMISQAVAFAEPDRVERLVLCDTAHKIGPPSMWSERISAISEVGLEAASDAVMTRWFPEATRARDPVLIAGCKAMVSRMPQHGYLGVVAALRDADLSAQTPKIQAPTLVVVGTEDTATTPALVASMADLIPNSELKQIEGVGHIPCLEQPEHLAELIINHCGLS